MSRRKANLILVLSLLFTDTETVTSTQQITGNLAIRDNSWDGLLHLYLASDQTFNDANKTIVSS